MKVIAIVVVVTIVTLTSCTSASQPNDSRVVEVIHPESGFKHPGIFYDKAMIDAMARSVNANDSFRMAAWNNLLRHKCSKLENMDKWKAKKVILGYDNYNLAMASTAANSFALQWIVTGETKYAAAAVEIIRRWSSTLSKITPKPDDKHQHNRLLSGIHCGFWANAGELLKCSGVEWREEDQRQFRHMLRKVFLPAMLPRPNHFNGNWDLACTKSTMAIAVFLDDRKLFDENIERLKSGKTNGSIPNYLLPSGQCQESGRDQGHAQMGLDFLAQACEIAWHQGIDLYEFENRSVGRCFEYLAKYNLGHDDLPFELYPSPVGRNSHDKATSISDKSRGKLQPIYTRVNHHYRTRLGKRLPFVEEVILQNKIEKTDVWCTLLYGIPDKMSNQK